MRTALNVLYSQTMDKLINSSAKISSHHFTNLTRSDIFTASYAKKLYLFTTASHHNHPQLLQPIMVLLFYVHYSVWPEFWLYEQEKEIT